MDNYGMKRLLGSLLGKRAWKKSPLKGCNEEWFGIPGYDDRYSLSNMGRVRSNKRVVVYKTGYEREVESKVLSTRKNNRGIEIVDLYYTKDGKMKKATRSLNVLRKSIKELN